TCRATTTRSTAWSCSPMATSSCRGGRDCTAPPPARRASPAGRPRPAALHPDGVTVWLGPDGRPRLRADGSLDTGFGQGGVAPLVGEFRAAGSEVRALARQPNGKLVIGGVIGNQVALARWDSRGDLDRAFGDDGLVMTPVAAAGSRVGGGTAGADSGV